MTEDDKSTGLEARYEVRRISDPDGKHYDCRFFVLDPKHDPIARDALALYADRAERNGYSMLADDLNLWLEELAAEVKS